MSNYRGVLILLGAMTVLLPSCNDHKKTGSAHIENDSLSFDTAQTEHPPLIKDTLATTSIKWLDSTFKDMGVLKNKDSLLINFRFKNTGEKPLVVRGVRTTCGCTIADTLYKPVMPGKESAIKVKFYSAGQAVAVHEKHVYVLTNTLPYPGTTLTFKVDVEE